VDQCLAAGVSLFDTADAYSGGLAEEILGQGVRYVGVSNYAGWQLTKALRTAGRLGLPRFVSQQIYYPPQAREAEYELIPAAVDQGLGVLVWNPLAGGLLSGKHRRDRQPPQTSAGQRFGDAPDWADCCAAAAPGLGSQPEKAGSAGEGALCAPADAFIAAVTCSVPFQAQQAKQPAAIVNDSQPAPPFPQQRRGRGTERVCRPRRAADERAEPGDGRRTRGGRGKIGPLDRGDQPPARGDDQSHMDVVVLQQGPDLRQPGSGVMHLRVCDHGIANAPFGREFAGRGHPLCQARCTPVVTFRVAARVTCIGRVPIVRWGKPAARSPMADSNGHRPAPAGRDGVTSTTRRLVMGCPLWVL
jgi:Aldo/keto reductase family